MVLHMVRDARAVVGGVLLALIVGILLTRTARVDPLLARVLRTLPPEVVAVILEPDHPSVLRPVLQQLLHLPESALPSAPSPVVTLFLNTEHGVMPLVLFDRGKAQRAGLQGSAYGGFLVMGDTSVVALLHRERPESTSHLLVEGTQFLRTAPQASLRFLVRLRWLTEQFPALGIPSVPNEAVLALAAEAQNGRLTLSGIIAGQKRVFRTPAGLLTAPVPGSLLVLDGAAAADLLPRELPPVLAALAQEAGITAELADISRILRDRPMALVLLGRAESVPDFVVATRRHSGDTELAGALRALLVRRSALTTARTEVLRINGRRIRHQRSETDSAQAVQETFPGPWRIVEAPRAAGTKDLVSAERNDLFLVGTSKAAVLAVGTMIPEAAQNLHGRAIVHVAVDGRLLRREPLVSHVLRGVPAAVRVWAETLDTLRLDVFDNRRSLQFLLTGNFESGALLRAF